MILAGDIGGTNTRLALAEPNGSLHASRDFPSQRHATLAEIVHAYLDGIGRDEAAKVSSACFGVAGPVEQKEDRSVSRVTNLPWTIDTAELAASLNLGGGLVLLINDLAANAAGIPAVPAEKVVTVHAGQEQVGNRAIISAGTGLGQAGLLWNGREHEPIPSEGGHCTFGPRDANERDLSDYLATQAVDTFRGHVSWERVLSGPGLFNVFDHLRARGIGRQRVQIPPGTKPGEATKLISAAGLDGSCERSGMAVDRFVKLYGAAAGNVALQFTALNGVYVGGGIAPKLIQKLMLPAFVDAFLDKGAMRPLLERIPLRIIMDEQCALRGAARFAVMTIGA